jgi:hypothetical protein
MDQERWHHLRPYLDKALDLAPDDRASLLDALAVDDPAAAAELREKLDICPACRADPAVGDAAAPCRARGHCDGAPPGGRALTSHAGKRAWCLACKFCSRRAESSTAIDGSPDRTAPRARLTRARSWHRI